MVKKTGLSPSPEDSTSNRPYVHVAAQECEVYRRQASMTPDTFVFLTPLFSLCFLNSQAFSGALF